MGFNFQDKFDGKMQDLQGRSETGLEQKVVKNLMRAAKYEGRPDRSKLEKNTLDWFYENYSFPVRIRVDKIPWLHEKDWGDLFTRFTKTPMVEALDEWLVESKAAGNARCGVVAQWPKRGLLVIHNYFHHPNMKYTQVVRKMKCGTVIFEELDALLDAICEANT